MTANVEIEVARKSNVLRLPAAATRFRPTEEMFVVLAQEVPPEARPGGGRSMGRGGARGAPDGGRAGASQPAEAATAPQSGAASRASGREAAGGGRGSLDPNTTPDERRRRFEERMANMSPEERERFQRMREQRAQGGNQTGERSTQGFGRRDMSRGIAGGVSGGSAVASGATTIDALFAPLPTVESRGRVWLYIDKQLKPISVRLGISDGTFTELLSGDLNEGQEVVVNMVTGLEQRTTTPNQGQSGNPLMGPQRGPQRGGRGR
jgi:hypothetical protein